MPKSITDQLDEMSKHFSSELAGATGAPSSASAATDAPSTQAVATDAPSTQSPATASPATKAPTTEAPPSIDDEVKFLRSEVTRLSKLAEPRAPKTKAPSTDLPVDNIDFLGDVDPYDITRDKEEFNKLLNTVYKKGVEFARSDIGKRHASLTESLPLMTRKTVETLETLRATSEKFYSDNPDLKPFRKVIATVFDELSAAAPDKHYSDILKDVEAEARTRLNLPKKAATKPPGGPRLPRKGIQSRPADPGLPSDPVLTEIAEMDRALNQ